MRTPGRCRRTPPLDLLIAPADAALIGKTTYYVRETPAGEPRRVLSQYIWVFGRTVEVHSKASDMAGMCKARKSIWSSISTTSRSRSAGCGR